MKQNPECIFCQIVEGSSPTRVLLEHEHCLTFLDIGPAGKGHTLVIPKIHSVDTLDTASEALSEVIKMTQQASELLFLQLKPDGISIFQRWSGDSLVDPWVETLAWDLELTDLHREILSDL